MPLPLKAALVAATAALTVIPPGLFAHESGNDGHIPANVNYGFTVIGRDLLGGVSDGAYTDVWSHKGYAYVGTFQEPECSRAGVFIVDIDQAIANYGAGSSSGAVVATIKSAPNTRINDVKVHTVMGRDILITTQEPCGSLIPGFAPSGGESAFQLGQGGISIYDVTNPAKPRSLRRNFMEFEGVHNTFPFDWQGKSYLLGTANTFDFQDTFVVDISRPWTPKLIALTGALDWLGPDQLNLDQLETGTSGGIFNHDIWVEIIDGRPVGLVSYWDAGFVTLDLSDPANPVFLDDSTYPDPEPILGVSYEGNAHAAVFGGANGEYIFGGDEDFSPASFGVLYAGISYPAAQALFGPDPATLSGDLVWTGGEGCTAAAVPPATASGQVALIQRGSCFFQDKADAAEAQGYAGYIVANTSVEGDALINMSPRDDQPVGIPGIFVGYSTGEDMKANPGQPVSASSLFDGWGYLHVINNSGVDVEVPSMGINSPATMTVPQMHELGYYAPAEAVEEGLGTAFGDLTMHNIEVDPLTRDDTPTYDGGPRMFVSWYSLGMRALEYRPGHFHANLNGEGSYSQNVHEVGRWIEPDGGSDFWGVHVDELDNGDQIILGSDRNLGLYVFSFSCVTRVEVGGNPADVFYCDPATTTPGE